MTITLYKTSLYRTEAKYLYKAEAKYIVKANNATLTNKEKILTFLDVEG